MATLRALLHCGGRGNGGHCCSGATRVPRDVARAATLALTPRAVGGVRALDQPVADQGSGAAGCGAQGHVRNHRKLQGHAAVAAGGLRAPCRRERPTLFPPPRANSRVRPLVNKQHGSRVGVRRRGREPPRRCPAAVAAASCQPALIVRCCRGCLQEGYIGADQNWEYLNRFIQPVSPVLLLMRDWCAA